MVLTWVPRFALLRDNYRDGCPGQINPDLWPSSTIHMRSYQFMVVLFAIERTPTDQGSSRDPPETA